MTIVAKPILKWVGGKRQLLTSLIPFVPEKMNRYIEPMIGGGALFMALTPQKAIIADSNPELINFYRSIVADMDGLIAQYNSWPFDEVFFYKLRAERFEDLTATYAAARTLFLNRVCFNGLYRVNRDGGFNVPWGRYKKPYVVVREQFAAIRTILAKAEIKLGDFREVLMESAEAGDFIFLDPPYVPISNSADFKRYTRTQFHDQDHYAMADLVKTLSARGCDILITNSNHPLVHDLYQGYHIEIVQSKRSVNSNGNGRTGEDVIIHVPRA
jgi:DNA adenine methylase